MQAPLNQHANQHETEKAARRKRLIFALCCGGVALFMYVSFILKTAINGP